MADAPAGPEKLNPWTSIWLKPRRTIRGLLDSNSFGVVWLLAAANGVGWALDEASNQGIGDTFAWPVIVAAAIVAGPLLGVVGLYVGSWFVFVTGSGLRGEATSKELRAALAWGGVPVLISYFLYVPLIAIFGQGAFTTEFKTSDDDPRLLAALAFFLAALIWSLLITARTVAEAQRFGAWKGAANLVLASLALLVAVWLFGFFTFIAMGLLAGLSS